MTDHSRQPAVTGFNSLHYQLPTAKQLSGGIALRTIAADADDLCRLTLSFRGGVLAEQQPLQSLCAMQMLTEGTLHHSAEQVAEEFDFLGANVAMQSYDNYCEASLVTTTRNYGAALDMLNDCLQHPTFDANRWEVLQRRLRPVLARMSQQVKTVATVNIQRMIYGEGHPLATDFSPTHVDALSPELLRQYYQQNVQSCRCHAVLSGRVDNEILRHTIAALDNWQSSDHGTPEWPRTSSAGSNTRTTLYVSAAVQAAIVFALPLTDASYADLLDLRVLITTLGGYFGSRLMQNIREQKGYTYGISGSMPGVGQNRWLRITTECDPAYIEPVISEVHAEMQRLRCEPIGTDELNDVKQFLLGEWAKLLDHPFKQASLVNLVTNNDLPADHYNRTTEAIMHVTPQRLQTLAQQYFDPTRLRIAVATCP